MLSLTLWPSLLDTKTHSVVRETWPEVVDRFRNSFVETEDKMRGPGFGPYAVTAPARPCPSHPPGPHRCDACVPELTATVWDADEGTRAQVDACVDRLTKDGIAWLLYSTNSYEPGRKESFRIVSPNARPVSAEWPSFRRAVHKHYGVPANLAKCGGRSHFYFLPSAKPGAPRVFLHSDGAPLDPSRWTTTSPAPRGLPFVVPALEWEPPEDPTEPVDMAAVRARVDTLRRKKQGRPDALDKHRAELLRRTLAGEPLAGHGSRNETTARVAGMLGYWLHDLAPSVVLHLMRPSVERMISDGSSITWGEVERMVVSAMRKRADEEARTEGLRQWIRRSVEAVKPKR